MGTRTLTQITPRRVSRDKYRTLGRLLDHGLEKVMELFFILEEVPFAGGVVYFQHQPVQVYDAGVCVVLGLEDLHHG